MSHDPNRLTEKHIRSLVAEGHITPAQGARIHVDGIWCHIWERVAFINVVLMFVCAAACVLMGLQLWRIS